MQKYFYSLSDSLFKIISADEILLLSFEGEDSDFVRLNKNKIRQAGSVAQRRINLDLIKEQQHANATCELSGSVEADLQQLTQLINTLRQQRDMLPQDPYLNFSMEVNSNEYHHDNSVIDSHAAVEQIIHTAKGLDLVGIFANGIQYTGFASSTGQKNWHSSANFNFDWSCYHSTDKAVKSSYAGFDWQSQSLEKKFDTIKQQLSSLAKPAKTIKPGKYRVYLAPAATSELLSMMAWGGFGLKAHKTKTTPLIQMLEQERKLSPLINLCENHSRGLAASFTGEGFIKPDKVQLIENGHYKDCLVNPRSAKEYNARINTDSEYPGSLQLSGGGLNNKNVLSELDTGLYINNLWYLNFSDRNACRLTGMTRFACFWVENGVIKSPLNVMRFDDSIYDLLGTHLIDLTNDCEFIFDASTYGKRSSSSIELPGALINEMNFTL